MYINAAITNDLHDLPGPCDSDVKKHPLVLIDRGDIVHAAQPRHEASMTDLTLYPTALSRISNF